MPPGETRRRDCLRVVLGGTGTGVGKTHVACALLRAWGERTGVTGLKPIETGVAVPSSALLTKPMPLRSDTDSGAVFDQRARRRTRSREREAVQSDQERLARAAELFHVKQSARGRARVAGWRSGSAFSQPRHALFAFSEPVSPHLAAEQVGVRIDAGEVERWVKAHEAPVTIIETAGGLFSPLGHGSTNFDLVQALRPNAVILVAPDRLGVLHELTTTLGFAAVRGGAAFGVVLSTPATRDASTGHNAAAIGALGIARPVVVFPRAAEGADVTLQAARTVIEWVERGGPT
jgi:dethiobiotin synthetase